MAIETTFICDKCLARSKEKFADLNIQIVHGRKVLVTNLGYEHLCQDCTKPIFEEISTTIKRYANSEHQELEKEVSHG